jgi:plasmid stabilization system protein ParE
MKSTFEIIWTEEAQKGLNNIFNYLETKWTNREISNFAKTLDDSLYLICSNLKLNPWLTKS